MRILPMPADWLAEHTTDAEWRRALIAAFRVPAHLFYPSMSMIIDMTMHADRISLVSESGDTVRVITIGSAKD